MYPADTAEAQNAPDMKFWLHEMYDGCGYLCLAPVQKLTAF